LETCIEGAKSVLLNITGGADLGIFEVNEAADLVFQSADPDANIIFGAVIDESMEDEIRITVIATGFEEGDQRFFERRIEVAGLPEEKGDGQKISNYGNEDIDIPTFLRNRYK